MSKLVCLQKSFSKIMKVLMTMECESLVFNAWGSRQLLVMSLNSINKGKKRWFLLFIMDFS